MRAVIATGVLATAAHGFGHDYSEQIKVATEVADAKCVHTGEVHPSGKYMEVDFDCNGEKVAVYTEHYDGIPVAEYVERYNVGMSAIPAEVVAAANTYAPVAECQQYNLITEVSNGHKVVELEGCHGGDLNIKVDGENLDHVVEYMGEAFDSSKSPFESEINVAAEAVTKFYSGTWCLPTGKVSVEPPYTEVFFKCEGESVGVYTEVYNGVREAEHIEKYVDLSAIPANVVAEVNKYASVAECHDFHLSTEVSTGEQTYEFDDCKGSTLDIDVAVESGKITETTINYVGHEAFDHKKSQFASEIKVAADGVAKFTSAASCTPTGTIKLKGPYTEAYFNCDGKLVAGYTEVYDGVRIVEYIQEYEVDVNTIPADVLASAMKKHPNLSFGKCKKYRRKTEVANGEETYTFKYCEGDEHKNVQEKVAEKEVADKKCPPGQRWVMSYPSGGYCLRNGMMGGR